MVEHSLAIHRFQSRLALTGRKEDGPPLAREVGRTMREVLPAAVGRSLEPLLASRDGVLRINRIALTVRLGRGEVSAVRIADLIARELAQIVADGAEGGHGAHRIGAGFAFWPDHASFAASYLANRLGHAPVPQWAFPDFRTLAHLSPHEAALELLVARPPIFAALARLLGAAGATALAASLPEQTAALLIDRLVTGLPADLPAGAEAELATIIAALPATTEFGPARVAVAATAAALAMRMASAEAAVRRIAMLTRLAVALAELRAAVLAWGRSPAAADLSPEALARLPEPARQLAEGAVAPLTGAAPVRAALARVLAAPHQRTDASGLAKAAMMPCSISSRIAGIGLLMPTALAYGLPDRLSPGALHRTLAAALGPEDEGAARRDPLLAALAPFNPRDPDPAFPPVPESLRAAVPQARREGAAEDEGARGWAACLIHAFAATLPGFETSSLPYLRRQFLARPGALHVAEGRLTVVLDPLPLGIVLRLSGIHGWAERLPQARNTLLLIQIRES